MCTKNGAKPLDKNEEEYIDSRCIVEFRPNDDWEGEYGFDWYRDDYEDIIGNYDPDDPDEYDPDEKDNYSFNPTHKRGNYQIKDIKNGYYKVNEYIIPWLNLFYYSSKKDESILPAEMVDKFGNRCDYCKYKVTIKLKIDAENIKNIELKYTKDDLEFPCDKDGAITANPSTITDMSTQTITISYNYPNRIQKPFFSIKAYANHNDGTRTLAGQINVIKRDPKIVDICLVHVISQFVEKDNRGVERTPHNINKIKNDIRKFLAQATIIPNFVEESLYVPFFKKNNDNDEYHFYANKYWDSKKNYFVFLSVDNTETEGKLLIDKLEKKFEEDYQKNEVYNDWYKIFLLCREGYDDKSDVDREYSIAGVAMVGRKSAIIYKSGENSATHELFHCFGLEHSFSNKNQRNKGYTYRKCKTDNIMDYKYDEHGKESDNNFKLISSWKWQWDFIWRTQFGLRMISYRDVYFTT